MFTGATYSIINRNSDSEYKVWVKYTETQKFYDIIAEYAHLAARLESVHTRKPKNAQNWTECL